MNLNLCLDAVPNFLGSLDLSIAPTLLFYAYIPIFILSIFFGFFINKKDNNSIISKYFLGITLSFALWILLILFQWTGAYLETVHLAWQLLILPEISIFLFAILFTYVFIFKKDMPIFYKYILSFLYITIAIILPTKLNINSFDLTNCEGILGTAWPLVYVFELLAIIVIVLIAIEKLFTKKKEIFEKLKTILLSAGMVFFLSIFWLSNYFGELTKTYEINLIGPIGMVIFLGLLSYLIVRFKAFNIKLVATQVLVWVLIILIGSQFFFIKVTTNFILNGVTFIGIIVFGQFLIKSVKREVKQREQLEVLTTELSVANEKLKGLDKLKTEFVSLASHQLRSPLTAIKGYTSMLIDGDYGEINPQAKEKIERIMESSNNLTLVVDDLLNVTKIEQGGMKYEMIKFDFGELVLNTVKDLSVTAENKGLKLICNIPDGQKYFVNGDKEKLRQVLVNLIDNSIKYTKEGQIEINLMTKKEKILLSIKDTGVGISKETIGTLFEKFSRGDGAKLNTSGSGLGLYLVKEIVDVHKGRVWVESEGVGKGSTFFVEINEVN